MEAPRCGHMSVIAFTSPRSPLKRTISSPSIFQYRGFRLGTRRSGTSGYQYSRSPRGGSAERRADSLLADLSSGTPHEGEALAETPLVADRARFRSIKR